jgi:hypothetical protein
MEELYEQLLQDMELALNELASKVPPPQPVPFASSFVYRHIERMPHQAIVQKLARMITGLRAALLLVRHGLLQEQGVMHRILDDIREDVMFLSYGIFRGETIKHKAFLEDFFQEEFDNPSVPLVSTQSRRIVPRKKIQAYLARVEAMSDNPSQDQEISRTLSAAYSGFVHGASPQIMEMYGGIPPRFHVRGMLDTPIGRSHYKSNWNYFDRGIATFVIAAAAFGDQELVERLKSQKRNFELQTGRDH